MMPEAMNNREKATKEEAEEIMLKTSLAPVEQRLDEFCRYMTGGINLRKSVAQIGKGPDYRVTVWSEDLKDFCGILSPLYKKLMIQDFGCEIFVVEEESTKVRCFQIFLPLNFRYEYVDGGSNGSSIFMAMYDSREGKWFFRVGR